MNPKNKHLNESLMHINIAERLTSTYKLVEDKKLLLKALEEIQKSIINSLNILNKNILFSRKIKKIKKNFLHRNFLGCSKATLPRRGDFQLSNIIKILKKSNFQTEDINKVMKILDINDKHKKSALEFSRKEKIVIMMDNLNILTLDMNEIKDYIKLAKKLYIKAGFNAIK